MRLLTLFTLMTVYFTVIGQVSTTREKPLTSYSYIDIDTEARYTFSTGKKGVIIQNSIRRAGGTLDDRAEVGYTDSSGKHFAYAVFWTCIINETTMPFELTLNFPADSFPVSMLPTAYFKVFLPSDTMTLEKQYLYNYGATGLKKFFDNNFNKPTTLQRTIQPKEAYLFYTAALAHQTEGIQQAGYFLKGRDLFYSVNVVGQVNSRLIPCGQILIRDKR